MSIVSGEIRSAQRDLRRTQFYPPSTLPKFGHLLWRVNVEYAAKAIKRHHAERQDSFWFTGEELLVQEVSAMSDG